MFDLRDRVKKLEKERVDEQLLRRATYSEFTTVKREVTQLSAEIDNLNEKLDTILKFLGIEVELKPAQYECNLKKDL